MTGEIKAVPQPGSGLEGTRINTLSNPNGSAGIPRIDEEVSTPQQVHTRIEAVANLVKPGETSPGDFDALRSVSGDSFTRPSKQDSSSPNGIVTTSEGIGALVNVNGDPLKNEKKIDTDGAGTTTDTSANGRLRSATELAMERTALQTPQAEEAGNSPTGTETPPGRSAAAEVTPVVPATPEASTAPGETTPPAAAEAGANTARSEAEKREYDELKALRDGNKPMTAEQVRRWRDLNQSPEQRADQMRQIGERIDKGDPSVTESEMSAYAEFTSKTEVGGELTPEQKLEKLNKDINELGTELVRKFANGEEVTQDDLKKLRNLRAEESLLNKGFTPEQARAAMNAAVKGETKGGERQIQAMKDIQDKIQELMSIEYQLLGLPNTIKELRAQRKEIVGRANSARNDAESAKTPEERLQKKGEENNYYMQIANINAAIVRQKFQVPHLQARQQDLEQYVRRKVGASSGLGALIEFGSAKINLITTELGIGVAEEISYRTSDY